MAEPIRNTVLVIVLEDSEPGAPRYLAVGQGTKVEDQETRISTLQDVGYVRLKITGPDEVSIVGYVADADGDDRITDADRKAYTDAGRAALKFFGFKGNPLTMN
ncbi:hypothetical protein [Pseudomonas eucalypticola]|uniref:Uncharacterized protein n=1 Tax=Pseudomonas eucalypticola TaxID=2599595 RepID=A0A7D5D3V8_9PSED|nr:hypothetical protein [Pseudomonas eucalypticola]QKZ02314.1 hypothetical protein HWQ56_00275 [Pseudomonas eucalypticola]